MDMKVEDPGGPVSPGSKKTKNYSSRRPSSEGRQVAQTREDGRENIFTLLGGDKTLVAQSERVLAIFAVVYSTKAMRTKSAWTETSTLPSISDDMQC